VEIPHALLTLAEQLRQSIHHIWLKVQGGKKIVRCLAIWVPALEHHCEADLVEVHPPGKKQ
jgi:hypothetical protein